MGMRLAHQAAAIGCALIVVGIALVHPPSAMIVAGLILVGTSYMVLDAFGAKR